MFSSDAVIPSKPTKEHGVVWGSFAAGSQVIACEVVFSDLPRAAGI